jgi:hypothetical protein
MKMFSEDSLTLMWLDDWAVWPSGQRIHVFDRFRLSYGDTRPLINSPAHLFDRAEYEDAISFVTIALLFLWDCYVLTSHGRKLLFFSLDEYGVTTDHTFLKDITWLKILT